MMERADYRRWCAAYTSYLHEIYIALTATSPTQRADAALPDRQAEPGSLRGLGGADRGPVPRQREIGFDEFCRFAYRLSSGYVSPYL